MRIGTGLAFLFGAILLFLGVFGTAAQQGRQARHAALLEDSWRVPVTVDRAIEYRYRRDDRPSHTVEGTPNAVIHYLLLRPEFDPVGTLGERWAEAVERSDAPNRPAVVPEGLDGRLLHDLAAREWQQYRQGQSTMILLGDGLEMMEAPPVDDRLLFLGVGTAGLLLLILGWRRVREERAAKVV